MVHEKQMHPEQVTFWWTLLWSGKIIRPLDNEAGKVNNEHCRNLINEFFVTI